MIYYQRKATLAEVADAYAIQTGSASPPAPETHFHSAAASLANIRASHRGGSAARSTLLRMKIGETQDQWRNRWNNFQNVPLVRIITTFRSSLLYVKPPERCVEWESVGDPEYDATREEDNQQLDDAFNAIYESNCSATLFSKQVAPRTNRDQASWVKVWHDSENDLVRLTSYKYDNVLAVLDPDDSETVLGYVELRPRGTDFDRWLWTTSEYGLIDKAWNRLGEFKPNPIIGEMPFIQFGGIVSDIGNQLDDAVMDQAHLVNLRSHVAMGIRSQTYKQLWTAGKIKGPRVKSAEGDGNERVMLSPETVIQMDDGGSVNYASPDFPVSAVLEAERQELKRSLETYRVSAFSVDPSSAPEQPMSLAIKMLPSMWARQEDIASFTDSERALARMVLLYGSTFGYIPCSVEDVYSEAVKIEINFESTILPSDAAVERQADAADVAAQQPLMLREDYIRKYHAEGADQNEIDAMMLELDAQAAARAAMTASMFGGITPARPAFNLAGASPGAGSNGQSNASALLARLGQPGDGQATSYTGGGGGTGSVAAASSGTGAVAGGPGSGGGKTVPTLG